MTRQKSPHRDEGKERREKRKKKKFYKEERKEPEWIARLPQRRLLQRRGALYKDMGRLLRAMSQLQ